MLTASGALAAVWSPAVDLSASGGDAFIPQVAVGPDGQATAVWVLYDGSNYIVQERRIAADGSPAAATNNLSASGGDAVNPQVAVGPDGQATVVWRRYDGFDNIVQERRIAADGTPAASTNDLSASGGAANDPQVAVGPDGQATVVWQRHDGSNYIVQERRIAADGSPAASTNDLSASGGDADDPQVAVGPDGTATVVWQRHDGSNYIVQERRIAADGSPDAATNDLSTSFGFNPQVAVGPDGSATVVWFHTNRSGAFFSNQLVQERRIAADGSPDAATNELSAPAAFDAELGNPQVVVGPDGTATAVWGRYPSSHIVQSSTFTEPTSNSFTIGKPKRNKKRGTATLPVTVPGPGTLTLRGKGVISRRPALGRPTSRLLAKTVSAAGTVKLLVKAHCGTKRKLNKTGKAKVRVTITYTPTGGAANSKSRSLTLKKKLG